MARQVRLTTSRPERSSDEFVRNVGNGNGNPPSPLKGGGGGFPLARRRASNLLVETRDSSHSHIVENVEQQALGMSKADRQALLDRLSLSLLETDDSRDVGMWAVGVCSALQARLGTGMASTATPTLAKTIVGTKRAFAPLKSFVDEVGVSDMTVPQRQAALNYLATLVVDDAAELARHTKQPLGLKLVAQRAAHVRSIFEQAFPTYLAAGIAKIVFRRMVTMSDWDGDRSVAT